MPYTYEHPRPSLTVDCVIFGYEAGSKLKVLLIQRGNDPYEGMWALPGGFVEEQEELREAAARELEEETGVKDVFIEQLFTFGVPGRDPRGRVVTVAYYALVNFKLHPVSPSSGATNAEWFDVEKLPQLAFDHKKIMEVAVKRLRTNFRLKPIGFELLPKLFTLSQLQKLYETVLGVPELNKRNFRTRILKMGVLDEMGKQENVSHRPAILYKFNKEKYEELAKQRELELIKRGVDFEV